jgi:mono/diheme cytochrome c family protein
MTRNSLFATGIALAAIGFLGISQAVSAGGAIEVAQADDPDTILMTELKAEGETLYTNNCADCHGRDGGGNNGPKFVGNENLSSVSGTVGMILGGFVDHNMPAWAAVFDDREVAAVATYIRTAWGNDFGLVRLAWVANRR